MVLGCGYAALAVEHRALPFRTVGVFTGRGIAVALMTVVLVIAQT